MPRKKSPYPAPWSNDPPSIVGMAIALFKTDASYTTTVYDPEFHRIKIYMAQLQPRTLNS